MIMDRYMLSKVGLGKAVVVRRRSRKEVIASGYVMSADTEI